MRRECTKMFKGKRKKFIEKLRENARLCMEISDTEVSKHQYVSGLNWAYRAGSYELEANELEKVR